MKLEQALIIIANGQLTPFKVAGRMRARGRYSPSFKFLPYEVSLIYFDRCETGGFQSRVYAF